MKPHDKLACVFLTMLCAGLGLIGYGAHVMSGTRSIAFVITGAALSYAALRLYETLHY